MKKRAYLVKYYGKALRGNSLFNDAGETWICLATCKREAIESAIGFIERSFIDNLKDVYKSDFRAVTIEEYLNDTRNGITATNWIDMYTI